MGSVRYTDKAEADLIDIWTYIALDNSTAADGQLDRIEEACLKLGQFPSFGPARPDIAEGLRYFTVGNYLILYRVAEDCTEIVRVVFGGRNLASLF